MGIVRMLLAENKVLRYIHIESKESTWVLIIVEVRCVMCDYYCVSVCLIVSFCL